MTEIEQLIHTIKRRLKSQGLTYRALAEVLKLSEVSVKRMLSTQRLTLDRLLQISHFLGFTLEELAQEAAILRTHVHRLSIAQEKELVSHPPLLLVCVCILNHFSAADIVARYALSDTECTGYLAKLDRLGLITLLPGNRVRLNVARDFEWLPQGPIRAYFEAEGLHDFLDSPFSEADETFGFSHAMLTHSARQKMLNELRGLRQTLAALHQESLALPLSERQGMGLVLAFRSWETPAFQALRRLDHPSSPAIL